MQRGGVGRDEAVVACAGVEGIDDVVGRGEQDAVAPGVQIGRPRAVCHVGGGLFGPDVHAPVVDVVPESHGVAAADRQCRSTFGGRDESHQLGQGQCVGFGGDVAQDTARRY